MDLGINDSDIKPVSDLHKNDKFITWGKTFTVVSKTDKAGQTELTLIDESQRHATMTLDHTIEVQMA